MENHFWIYLSIILVVFIPPILAESNKINTEVDDLKDLELMKDDSNIKSRVTVETPDEETTKESKTPNRRGRFLNISNYVPKDSQAAENQAIQYVQAIKIPEHMRNEYSRQNSQRSINTREFGTPNSGQLRDIFNNGVIENSKKLTKYRKNISNGNKKRATVRNRYQSRPDAFTSSMEITTFRPTLSYPITTATPFRPVFRPFLQRDNTQIVTVSPIIIQQNRKRISNVDGNVYAGISNGPPKSGYKNHIYDLDSAGKGNFNIVRAKPSLISSYREVPVQDNVDNVNRHEDHSAFVDNTKLPIENKRVFKNSQMQSELPSSRKPQFNNQEVNKNINQRDLNNRQIPSKHAHYPGQRNKKEPIFQDPRTHPHEVMYYNALEDEIRMSKFLTDSVRLVSSDSFDDLINETLKNKNKKSKVEKAHQIVPTKNVASKKNYKKISEEKPFQKNKKAQHIRKKQYISKEKIHDYNDYDLSARLHNNHQNEFVPQRHPSFNDYNEYEYDSYPTFHEPPTIYQSRLVSKEHIPGTNDYKHFFELDKTPKIDQQHFIPRRENQEKNELLRPTFSIPTGHFPSKEHYFHRPPAYIENNRRELKFPTNTPNHHRSNELEFYQPDDTHEVDFLDNLYIDENYNFNDYVAHPIDIASRRAWGSHPIHHFMDATSDVIVSHEKLPKPLEKEITDTNVYHKKEKTNKDIMKSNYKDSLEPHVENFDTSPPHLETKYFNQHHSASPEYDSEYFASPESIDWNSGVKDTFQIDHHNMKILMETQTNNNHNELNLGRGAIQPVLSDYSRVYDESKHIFSKPKTLQRLFKDNKEQNNANNESQKKIPSSYEFDPVVFTSMPYLDYTSRSGFANYKSTQNPKLLSNNKKIKKPEYIPSVTIRDLAAAPSLIKAFSKKTDPTKLPEIVVTDSKEEFINTFSNLDSAGTSDGTFPAHGYNIDKFFNGFPSFGYFDSTLDN